MNFEDIKLQIKQYIDESQTYGELLGKIIDLYMKDKANAETE